MTQIAKTLTLTLIALVGGILLGVLLAQTVDEMTTEAPAQSAPAADVNRLDLDPAAVSQQQGPDTGVLALLPEGIDLTEAQMLAVSDAADRVCEGFTAGVPVTTLEQGTAQALSVPLPEAHDFVATVLGARC